jgi:DNA-binding XRE family transcriptional regulator
MFHMEARIFYMIPTAVIVIALNTAAIIFIIKLLILLYRALRKYLNSSPQRQEETILRRSLGEVLKEHRTRCGMTQEFVAESLGVSRQAVSKWENGTADPSTSNLLKLAKLYGITPEELIRAVQTEQN